MITLLNDVMEQLARGLDLSSGVRLAPIRGRHKVIQELFCPEKPEKILDVGAAEIQLERLASR